ncbi:MAG: hypothetical protein FD143_2839 [Ignavibacteria bacterium]|nr:MAG: hypothetical protein FD143_2839 [Ignavibacteria bacterium]
MKNIVLFEPAAKVYISAKGGLVTDINKAKLYTSEEAVKMLNELRKYNQIFEMKLKEVK